MPKHLRSIIICLLLVLCGLAWCFEYPLFEVYFSVAFIQLAFDVWDFWAFRQRTDEAEYIKVRSFAWTSKVINNALLALFIYQLEEASILFVIVLSILVLSTLFNVVRDGSAHYQFTSDGVINLNTGKQFIKKVDIVNINISDNLISIDTQNYRNEFNLKKSDLLEPSWDEAVQTIKKDLYKDN